MQRFFLDQNLDTEIVAVKDRAVVHQMKNVLRLRKGSMVIFFNDRPEYVGFDVLAELKNIEGSSAIFMVRDRTEHARESSKRIVLFQSLIKKDNFEWVIQHGTEIGVSEFVPVISARSEKKSIQRARCEKILREAAEQSGRAFIPKLHDVLLLDKAIELAKLLGGRTYVAHEGEHDVRLHGGGDKSINLFIGPEGGWEDKEIFAVQRANFTTVSLGRLTLRAETAALVAGYTLLWI